VVTATLDIVQYYCVLCGVYCGYRNSSYSAMILCSVSRLLWLQQQYIYCNVTVFFVVYFGCSNSRYSAMVLCFVSRLLWLNRQ